VTFALQQDDPGCSSSGNRNGEGIALARSNCSRHFCKHGSRRIQTREPVRRVGSGRNSVPDGHLKPLVNLNSANRPVALVGIGDKLYGASGVGRVHHTQHGKYQAGQNQRDPQDS